MLDILLKLFDFFSRIWSSLSEEQKDNIIDLIVDTFESFFRTYFHESDNEASNG